MSNSKKFIQSVGHHLSFLVKELGFSVEFPETDLWWGNAHIEKKDIYVDVGWMHGEMDVSIGVSIETTVLRPYVSRIFSVAEIALYQDPGALQDAPKFSNYIMKDDEVDAMLKYEAQLMKKYCYDVLKGDIKILEEISRKRETR